MSLGCFSSCSATEGGITIAKQEEEKFQSELTYESRPLGKCHRLVQLIQQVSKDNKLQRKHWLSIEKEHQVHLDPFHPFHPVR